MVGKPHSMNIGMAFSSQMRIVWKIFGKRGRLQKLFYPRTMEYLQFTTADLNRYNNLSHSEIGNTRLPNYWETTQEEDEDIIQSNLIQLPVEGTTILNFWNASNNHHGLTRFWRSRKTNSSINHYIKSQHLGLPSIESTEAVSSFLLFFRLEIVKN